MEREIVAQRIKEFQIQEFMEKNLSNVGHSHTTLKKTPLGEKIVIHASRPGLIVGRKGLNIKELTVNLKKAFKLDNPQIEISEVKTIFLIPEIVAEKITQSLERFGSQRFKGIGHKMLERVIDSGALGVEILISGKIPGSRARTWRFYQGYLKKCGDVAISGVKTAYRHAKLKTGIIGVQVRIMPPDINLPDEITIKEAPDEQVEEPVETKTEAKSTKKKSSTKKAKKSLKSKISKKLETASQTKTTAKKTKSKEEAKEELTQDIKEEPKPQEPPKSEEEPKEEESESKPEPTAETPEEETPKEAPKEEQKEETKTEESKPAEVTKTEETTQQPEKGESQ